MSKVCFIPVQGYSAIATSLPPPSTTNPSSGVLRRKKNKRKEWEKKDSNIRYN